jgi:hypothetical protein
MARDERLNLAEGVGLYGSAGFDVLASMDLSTLKDALGYPAVGAPS